MWIRPIMIWTIYEGGERERDKNVATKLISIIITDAKQALAFEERLSIYTDNENIHCYIRQSGVVNKKKKVLRISRHMSATNSRGQEEPSPSLERRSLQRFLYLPWKQLALGTKLSYRTRWTLNCYDFCHLQRSLKDIRKV